MSKLKSNPPQDLNARHRERDQAYSEHRADIVEAAREYLNTIGHKKLSMEAIAKQAQCSRATVYRYFKDKEDLLQAIATENYERINEAVDEEIREVPDLRMKLAIGLARSMMASHAGDATHKFTTELIHRTIDSNAAGLKPIVTERVAPVYRIGVRDGWTRPSVSEEDAINWIMLSSTGLLAIGWPNIGGHILSSDEQVKYVCQFLLYPIFEMEDVLE